MKKITFTLGAAMAVAMVMGYGAYGQEGYLTFQSNNGLYDNFTSGTPMRAADMYVDFVWIAGEGQNLLGPATTADSFVMSWDQIENLSVGTTGASWGLGSASELALTESAPPPAVGNYNGNTFGLSGATAGEVISLQVFAWDAADGSTVAAAAQIGAPIGWSGSINYTLGSATAPGASFGAAGGGFDVNGVPEPTTLALAGLGGLSMLFFRRWNKQ